MRVSVPRRFHLVVLGTAMVSGCSLFVDLAEGPASSDASNLSEDAASVLDGTQGTVVVSDAEGTDGAAQPCVFRAGRFCEDFDNDAGLNCTLRQDLGGTFSVVSGTALSGVRNAQVGFTDAGVNKTTYCSTPPSVLAEGVTKMRLSFAVRFGSQLPRALEVTSLRDEQESTGRLDVTSNGLTIAVSFHAALLVDGGRIPIDPPELKLTLGAYGAWHRVDVDVDHIAKSVVLRVDGRSSQAVVLPHIVFSATSRPVAFFGTQSAAGLSVTNAYELDNLAVEALR